MRIRVRYLFLICVPLFFLSWIFIGLDDYVGDHEVGSHWNPFIKSKPTFQIIFKNPIVDILDIRPIEEIDEKTKIDFLEYCSIRWGINDFKKCYERTVSYII